MFKRLVVIGLVASAAALCACGTSGGAGGAGASSEVAAARLTAHPALAALEIALADPGIALRAEQRPTVEAIRAELRDTVESDPDVAALAQSARIGS